MKIVGVIPARYASTRLPGKPLIDICGNPMIWWVYQQALKVKQFGGEVYIATDDERIMKICEQNKLKAIMTSPLHKTPNDRIHETSTLLEADIYVCINGDEPLIQPNVIEASLPNEYDDIELYYSNVITEFTDPVELVDPANIKAIFNEKGEALWISRSIIPFPKGSIDFCYYKIIGVSAFSKKALDFYASTPRSNLEMIEELDMYRFLEHGKKVILKKSLAKTLSVDTPKDLEKVRKIIANTPPPKFKLKSSKTCFIMHSSLIYYDSRRCE